MFLSLLLFLKISLDERVLLLKQSKQTATIPKSVYQKLLRNSKMQRFPIMDYCTHGYFRIMYLYIKIGAKFSFRFLEVGQDYRGNSVEWGFSPKRSGCMSLKGDSQWDDPAEQI